MKQLVRLFAAICLLRAAPQELAKNRGGQPGLWAYGISGDLPIALVEIETEEEREVARIP